MKSMTARVKYLTFLLTQFVLTLNKHSKEIITVLTLRVDIVKFFLKFFSYSCRYMSTKNNLKGLLSKTFFPRDMDCF